MIFEKYLRQFFDAIATIEPECKNLFDFIIAFPDLQQTNRQNCGYLLGAIHSFNYPPRLGREAATANRRSTAARASRWRRARRPRIGSQPERAAPCARYSTAWLRRRIELCRITEPG
jgi:hypothetical protein